MRKFLCATLAAASLLLAGAANALSIYTVDFSPTATNNGDGAIGTAANFSAVGFQSDLASVLTISGTSGTVGFSETGSINVTSFKDSLNNTVTSGVNSDYLLGATFSLSGTGTWTGTTYNANPNPTFTITLYANGSANDPSTGTPIGTASLDPTQFQLAFAVALGSLGPGSTGSGFTSLTASLVFSPNPDYTGPDGFFQNINPPVLELAIGNAGGNTTNTSYAVNGAGTITTFTLPTTGANEGTANVTFEATTVPEPGMLSLMGLALAGLGVMRRRKGSAAA